MCLGQEGGEQRHTSLKVGDRHQTQEAWGVNLKSARIMNMALLAKLGWRMISNMDELWSRVHRSKYGVKEDDGAHSKEMQRCSHIWQGLVWGSELLPMG